MADRIPDNSDAVIVKFNPELDVLHDFGTFGPGTVTIICGTPTSEPSRFTINFLRVEDEDIPFCFDVRFDFGEDRDTIVRNTFMNGDWGEEERDLERDFPFSPDQTFELVITVNELGYTVMLDNKHLLTFDHRIENYSEFDRLSVSGDVLLHKIQGFTPPLPIYHPPLPYELEIGKLYEGQKVFIAGIPNPEASRMSFNIQNSDEICFHFDVRFDYNGDVEEIVRNSLLDGGQWGDEERELEAFPFYPEQYFELIMVVKKKKFKVFVNNEKVCSYKHRALPIEDFDTLTISGDVKIVKVQFT